MNYMALFAIVKKPVQARGSALPGAKLFLTPTVLLWHAGCTYLGKLEESQPCCALPSTP